MEKLIDETGRVWSQTSEELLAAVAAYEQKVLEWEEQVREEKGRQLDFPFFSTIEVRNMTTYMEDTDSATHQTEDSGSRTATVREDNGWTGSWWNNETSPGSKPLGYGLEHS